MLSLQVQVTESSIKYQSTTSSLTRPHIPHTYTGVAEASGQTPGQWINAAVEVLQQQHAQRHSAFEVWGASWLLDYS
jgi:hypothetical protein